MLQSWICETGPFIFFEKSLFYSQIVHNFAVQFFEMVNIRMTENELLTVKKKIMKKINLKAFKKDEVALKHLANVLGGRSKDESCTQILYTFCHPSDSDGSWWYGDTDY